MVTHGGELGLPGVVRLRRGLFPLLVVSFLVRARGMPNALLAVVVAAVRSGAGVHVVDVVGGWIGVIVSSLFPLALVLLRHYRSIPADAGIKGHWRQHRAKVKWEHDFDTALQKVELKRHKERTTRRTAIADDTT